MNNSFMLALFLTGTTLLIVLVAFFIGYLVVNKNKQNSFKRRMLEARVEEQEKTLNEISRNLHDNVAQLLGHIQMNLTYMGSFGDKGEDMKPYIKSSSDYLQEAILDVRHMSHSLSSQFLKSKGLVGAVTEDVEHIKVTNKMDCTIEVEGDEYEMKHETELAIFRISQEVINNMVKHSQATVFRVRIDYMPDIFTVTFSDNGKGFNPKIANPDSGIGLLNMHERAALIGGAVDINSAPNKGCRIAFSLPIKEAEVVALPTD